jgi:hypothetical protein
MLSEASNFYVSTGIVSNLYLGEILVWPPLTGNFWNPGSNPFGKTLSNFRITYGGGNIVAFWGDGNVSGINSNVDYTHTFQ